MCGGLVFQPLSYEYIRAGFRGNGPPHLQDAIVRGRITDEMSEVVVLSQVMPDKVNQGCGSGFIGAPIVRRVNGEPIRNLADLVEKIRNARRAAKSATASSDSASSTAATG